jgi:DNA polymerase-1
MEHVKNNINYKKKVNMGDNLNDKDYKSMIKKKNDSIYKNENINEKIFIIDGNSIICRYFYGIPERKSPDGININGVFGFAKFLMSFFREKLFLEVLPIKIIVCFDKARNNFRKEIASNYKQNRSPFPENFFHQMNLCEEMCNYFNIPVDFHDRYEADDLIASYCHRFKKPNTHIVVLSNDKDLLQLVSNKNNIIVYNVAKKLYFNEEEVKNTLSVLPHQIPEFLAISGDASDNISGIFKVGPKTAAKLLEKYENLENIIKSQEGIKTDFSMARFFLQLTLLYKEAPLQHSIVKFYHLPYNQIIEYFNRYNFQDLVKYLEPN